MAMPSDTPESHPQSCEIPRSIENILYLWTKPPHRDLLDCLDNLRLEPPIWNAKSSHAARVVEDQVDSREVVSYLSTIIKSRLGWIQDENQRDQIWALASRRLAERCGRTGMSESN
jgi:hypothetical protein